jgi:MFS family permease
MRLLTPCHREYKIGYAITSLIFVTNAFGFISAAIFVDVLRARVGRARTLMAAEILMITGNLMIVCTPPFPVVVLAFLFLGLGEATNTALSNVFAVNLNNS